MAELLLKLRDREISRTPITHTRMSIGRESTCDVVIDNAGVSRTHAVIVFLDGDFRIRDSDSQNGITVNGKRVREAALQYGDVVGIGKFELQLCETGDETELRTGSAAKAALPKNVVSTMQMDAAAAAKLRDEVLAKQRAKGARQRSFAPEAARAKPAADAARPKPAAARPRSEPVKRAPASTPAAPAPVAVQSTSPLKRGAIALAVVVPLALLALWWVQR
jgi:predicted component of type VI protein secretion system